VHRQDKLIKILPSLVSLAAITWPSETCGGESPSIWEGVICHSTSLGRSMMLLEVLLGAWLLVLLGVSHWQGDECRNRQIVSVADGVSAGDLSC